MQEAAKKLVPLHHITPIQTPDVNQSTIRLDPNLVSIHPQADGLPLSINGLRQRLTSGSGS